MSELAEDCEWMCMGRFRLHVVRFHAKQTACVCMPLPERGHAHALIKAPASLLAAPSHQLLPTDIIVPDLSQAGRRQGRAPRSKHDAVDRAERSMMLRSKEIDRFHSICSELQVRTRLRVHASYVCIIHCVPGASSNFGLL